MSLRVHHDVGFWHGTDQARCLLSSRYRGVSGLIADMLRPPSLTPSRHPVGAWRHRRTPQAFIRWAWRRDSNQSTIDRLKRFQIKALTNVAR